MFGMTSSEGTNAIDLLKRDHDDVDKMFAQYEDLKEGGSGGDKEILVAEICDALTVHAQIEEDFLAGRLVNRTRCPEGAPDVDVSRRT